MFYKESYFLEMRKLKKTPERVLSSEERAFSVGKKNKIRFLTGRYAVKKALFSCLKNITARNFAFGDLSVINDQTGKPQLQYSGRLAVFIKKGKIKNIAVSISHSKNWAAGLACINL